MGTVPIAVAFAWLGVAVAETPEVERLLAEADAVFGEGRREEALAVSQQALRLEETASTLAMVADIHYPLGHLDLASELILRRADWLLGDPVAWGARGAWATWMRRTGNTVRSSTSAASPAATRVR
jgi:hypothetical protein